MCGEMRLGVSEDVCVSEVQLWVWERRLGV